MSPVGQQFASLQASYPELAAMMNGLDLFSIGVAIAAILIVFVLFRLLAGGSKGDTILLLGAPGSGKTTLFLQLRDGSVHSGTVTSMEENQDRFTLITDKTKNAKPVQVVDVPGHPRIRRNFEAHLDGARGIVFVVDSVDFHSRRAEIAEQMYEVLANPSVSRRRLPLLLACNKTDQGPKAFSVEFIRKRLEKELEQLRSTRSTLNDTTGAVEGDALRKAGDVFTFEGLAAGKGPKVSFASLSALEGEIEEVHEFIRRCVPAQ